jgi:hypothetical protein
MDETPVKTRVRRKRGEGRERGETTEKVDDLFPGIARTTSPVIEDEDELGPTPVKPVAGFHSLFEMEGSSSRTDIGTSGQSSSLMTRLLSAGAKGKQRSTELNGSIDGGAGQASSSTSRDDTSEGQRLLPRQANQADDEQSIPEPSDADECDWEPATTVEPTRNRALVRPDKVLTISDDEIDEWDPEANHIRHRVKIVPTRSRPKKGDWSDDDLDDNFEQSKLDASENDEDQDDIGANTPALDDTMTSQTNPSIPSPPPTMSLLSLTSPNHRQGRYAKLKELRYKALFNPTGTDAQRLKAFQKGQEAFQSGEIEADDEEEDLYALGQDGDERGEIADDDWESESEGWKRTGVEMDDDAW